ncbi:hypothetical protein COHA_000593 [Chlorella ohadii]|uniref:Uncharacterized protein n=1 Tax=Chlorella ohadii TaxID=2649997 RepID=A0AAD5E0U1_9CHLO|nr:hypothetical protein COHA_000593 [Chlorella ohadii]
MSDPAAAAAAAAAPSSSEQGSSAAASTSGGVRGSGGMNDSSVVRVGEENKDSCVPKFDALWFCYSPAYQLQQYYVYGEVDDCFSKWTAFFDCLKKKTKYKEEVLAAEAEAKHPLWDIRTHAEAEGFWKREFGHLSGEQQEDAAEGARHTAGKATLV